MHFSNMNNSYFITVGILSVVSILFIIFKLKNEALTIPRLIAFQLSLLVVGMVGAKLFALHLLDWKMQSSIMETFLQGWRYPGALLAIVITAPLLHRLFIPRLPLFKYLDTLAMTIALSMVMMRVGCFIAGCCTGAIGQSFAHWHYPAGTQVWMLQLQQGLIKIGPQAYQSLAVLPVHFLFMLSSLVVFSFLLWAEKRKHYHGQLALAFLFLHELGKGLLEFLRIPFIQDLQITSLSIAAFGAIALLVLHISSLKWQFPNQGANYS